ncbi:MAG: alpha/beta fold hydrolase [Bdellovibrionales bacterium]
MIRSLFSSFVFFAIFFSSFMAVSSPRLAVVLLPGTLNSILPGRITEDSVKKILLTTPYFSSAIIQSLEEGGALVHVVKGLAPAGDLEENGRVALLSIQKWYRESGNSLPLILIGHSAGGQYALWLAAQNQLPIQKIVFVSTPFNGAKLAERFFGFPFTNILRWGPPSWFSFFDWRGLYQMKPTEVKEFFKRIRIPGNIELLAFGGSQDLPRSPLQTISAEYFSPALAVTAGLIGEESDGIVEIKSAYSDKVEILSQLDERINIQYLSEMHMPLEHPEQVLDYRIFKYMGARNSEFVYQKQRETYSRLMSLMNR